MKKGIYTLLLTKYFKSNNLILKIIPFFPFIFFLLSLILLFSCTEKPTFDNLFDPDTPLTPMQGGIGIEPLSDSKVQLWWQKNDDVKGNYRIERKVGNENYITRATVGANTTTIIDTALTINTLYTYRIFGVNDQNETGPISDSIQTSFVEITDLDVQQQDIFTAKLTWTHNCNYEEGYIIERKEVAQASKPVTNVTLRLTSESSLASDVIQSSSLAKRYIQIKQQKAKSKKQNLITDPIIESKESQKGKNDFIVLDTLAANTFIYIDDNLEPNNTYEYRIKAFTKYNESSYKTDVFYNIIPAPLEFSVYQENVHTFYLTWYDNSNGERGFKIERKIDNGTYEKIANLAPDTENYTDDINSKNSFNNVYYKLYAYYNEETSAIVYINSVIEFEPIYNLEYEKLTINKIRLTWEDTNEGEDGFIIEKRVNQGNWVYQDTITENEWTDENAEINQNIQYRVQVFSGDNYTDFVLTDEIDNVFPGPTNLNCIAINVDQIELEWTDNSIGEDGFIIEQKENTGNFIEVGTTSQSNFIVSNLSFDSDYIFRVKAFSGNNFSDYSNEFSINIKQVISPANLQGNVSLTEIETYWSDNCIFETGFIIQRKKEGDEYQTIHINNVNDTTYIDTSIELLTKYFYRVASVCVVYQSEWSNEIELFTGPENAIIVDCDGGGDYLTIQEGIDIADNGDLVIVKEGTYYENINFNGKNITVASLFFIVQDTSYISQTIIDGNHDGHVVEFSNGEDSTAVLSGFTITNGYASGNWPDNSGGGITCYFYSSPSLENLTITDNSASEGGGIYCSSSSPSLTNVTITVNSASSVGGGIYCGSSSPSLANVTITGNTASSFGGGIYCLYYSPSLTNVTITGNSAYRGGGIYCYSSSLCLTNVTITGNTASYGYGGGIHCCENPSISLKNCILWNDSPQEIYVYSGSSVTAYYSDIQGGWTGSGNINANPLFISSGDFHLQPGSPCIDAGNPASQYNDPDGSRNDMGAYGGPGGDW